MKDELKKPEYKDIKLVKVAYGDDDDQKSFQETQGLIQAYPNLKGIISPTTVGISAAARYLSDSPKKGKVKLTGLGTPNQMRKFVKDGTVEEFALWVPEDVGYLAGYAAAALVSGQITGKQGETFTAGKLGEHKIGQNGEIILGPPTAFNKDNIDKFDFWSHRRDAPAPLGRAGTTDPRRARGSGSSGSASRPTGRSSRGCASGRGLPAAGRGAGGASSAPRSSAPGSSTPHRGRARRATGSRARRSTSCSATRSPTRRRARCCRRPGGGRPGRAARPAADATLDYANTDTGEWLANCAACCVPEIAGACTRAGIPYDTVAGTIDDDERAWGKIAAWVRAAGVARALRRSRIGFLGHTYPGDARHVLGLHGRARAARRARRGARDRRPRRARRRASPTTRSRAKLAEIRAMFDFADPVRRPDRGPDRPTSSSTGRRAWRSASTGSPPTSTSTR